LAVLAGTVAVAGCGGEGDSKAKEKQQFSAASEPPDAFAERMAKLLETTAKRKDCTELELINNRSLAGFPCPPDRALRKSMASFELLGAEEYGTGAVIDYKSGKARDGAAIVLIVGPDRQWGVTRFGVITKPSTETSDEESRDGFAKTVDMYLTAVRKRDCEAYMKATFTGEDTKPVICEIRFDGTKDLAKRLKTDPSAKPKYEGGNSTYGFYTLETAKPKPQNLTISVIKTTGKSANPFLVLDVASSPTAAYQRRVLKELKQQQKKGDRPEMSPSRKTD
jgi:hypothetical protein